MRNLACLVCVGIPVLFAPSLLAAGDAAASSGIERSLLPGVANVRALPAISVLARNAAPAQDSPLAGAEIFDDSPLDLNIILLAGWLPIAGALLALAMEGTSPSMSRAREPGEEPSLD